MAGQSNLIRPSLVAEMKAELEDLSQTEPGAKDLESVIEELMPLIQGCRDRGHSWKKITESLKKFHSDISVSRLKRIAFTLDPSLKSKSRSTGKSLIPELDIDDSSEELEEESNWPPEPIA